MPLVTGGAEAVSDTIHHWLFAREGASVIVVDIDDDGADKTVDEVEAAGGKAIYVRADVSNARLIVNA